MKCGCPVSYIAAVTRYSPKGCRDCNGNLIWNYSLFHREWYWKCLDCGRLFDGLLVHRRKTLGVGFLFVGSEQAL